MKPPGTKLYTTIYHFAIYRILLTDRIPPCKVNSAICFKKAQYFCKQKGTRWRSLTDYDLTVSRRRESVYTKNLGTYCVPTGASRLMILARAIRLHTLVMYLLVSSLVSGHLHFSSLAVIGSFLDARVV